MIVDNKINICEYVEFSEYKIKPVSSVKEIQNCYNNMRKLYAEFDTKIHIVDYMSMVGDFKNSLLLKENNRLLSEMIDDIRTKFKVVYD